MIAEELNSGGEARVVLVTGAAGFAGRHLVQLLQQDTDWTIIALARRRAPELEGPRTRMMVADLGDPVRVREVVGATRPDFILHLAAATPPATDEEFFSINVATTVAMLESVATVNPRAAVLIVGSDAQYGRLGPAYLPTRETAPMHPIGTYGRSKVLQEYVARAYRRMRNLRVVCVRPFNHIGPGQGEHFVIPTLARQIAVAECGQAPRVIEMGQADAARDFTDVRDVVRAYLLGLLFGRSGVVYNIGSGRPRQIGDVAQMLAAAARIPVIFRSVPKRSRPHEVLRTHCDASRFHRATGWAPSVPIEQSLLDVLSEWRARVAAGGAAP